MNSKIPHLVQYQGSKRLLAPQILQYFPNRFDRLVEPFAGVAAVSIAAAAECRTNHFYINDLNAPLISMLSMAIENPSELIQVYHALWAEQFSYGDDHVRHFYEVRERFNNGEQSAANMLYLLARCVKGAVRYGKDGRFNQSPDKRRHGTSPETLSANVHAISKLLKGKTTFSALDYRAVLETVRPGDLVYLDPPYQGVTYGRDRRYCAGVSYAELIDALYVLNQKQVDYVVSYDGMRGSKHYGEELPCGLHCTKVLLNAGISAQSLLFGKKETTMEALYISNTLIPLVKNWPERAVCLEALA